MPADSPVMFQCKLSCSHKSARSDSILAPRVWFSHLFSQVRISWVAWLYSDKEIFGLNPGNNIVVFKYSSPFISITESQIENFHFI